MAARGPLRLHIRLRLRRWAPSCCGNRAKSLEESSLSCHPDRLMPMRVYSVRVLLLPVAHAPHSKSVFALK